MLAAAAKKASAGVGGSPAGAATSLGGDDSFDAADALFSPMRRGGEANERSELASAIAPKPTAARGLVLEDLEAVREGFPPGNDSEAPSGGLGPGIGSRRRPCSCRARRARGSLGTC